MSGERAAVRPRQRFLRVLPAVLAAPMALLVAGSLVVRAATRTDGERAIVGTVALGLLVVAVPVLAAVGALAAWRNRRRLLWGVTGGLLVLGMLPFGPAPQILLVALFVLLGTVNTTLDRRWYDTWFALAMLVPLWGIGALVYAYVPGHGAVLVVVGGVIILGASLSVVAAATGSIPPLGSDASSARPTRTADAGPVRRVLTGVARGPTWRAVWFLVAVWSITVSVLHFTGLEFRLYTRYWWWDVLTHGMSGFGVAAIVYLLRPAAFATARRLFVLLPALVLVVGAVFEVYEFAFRAFYRGWSQEFYLADTAYDLVVDVAGAFAFALLPSTRAIARRERESDR